MRITLRFTFWRRVAVLAIFSLVASWSSTCSAIVTGEYLFENNLLDNSGLGRHGTMADTPMFADGLYAGSNASLLMTGAVPSVELPGSTDFIRNAPGATLMAWARVDGGTGTRSILVVNNGNVESATGIGDARAIIQIDGGSGQFRALGRQADTGGSSSAVGFTPAVGQTYFVAGVFDYTGSAIRLYVNGEEVATQSPAWTMNSADTANLVARIGSHANGTTEFWNGAIDGARIFNTALPPEEIMSIYQAENVIIPGDTNGDGMVDIEIDLLAIRQNYLQSATMRSQGDLNGDGIVDSFDFREWKTAFLATGSGSLVSVDLSFLTVAVPEPSSLCLAALGLWWFGGLRRRTYR